MITLKFEVLAIFALDFVQEIVGPEVLNSQHLADFKIIDLSLRRGIIRIRAVGVQCIRPSEETSL